MDPVQPYAIVAIIVSSKPLNNLSFGLRSMVVTRPVFGPFGIHIDDKGRSLAFFTLHPDGPSHQLNEIMHDGKPKSGPHTQTVDVVVFLAERLEQMVLELFSHVRRSPSKGGMV